MFYPHKVQIQKLDQAQASAWSDYIGAWPCEVSNTDDDGTFRSATLRGPAWKDIHRLTGVEDLSKAFRVLWRDPTTDINYEFYIARVRGNLTRHHRETAELDCQAVAAGT